ncbi:hypothetical protein OSB04_011149 [Centaurea solstitialis]|uniref:Reverse transcriptase domain-containing protein n=1 Tax=Centaurea solstitialis TaxID=347529 RepID=A0AA38WL89_9ASTR|nr:hypothetical protein OSB04_011149 [Centaurea solstitialis]
MISRMFCFGLLNCVFGDNRNRGVTIGKLISVEQSAFIKGRSILDGVLVANEVVDFLKRKNKKGLIFKVDFEKAYDSVEWSFLLDAMENMGFGLKWRNWVKSCLSTSKVSVLVNGSPTGEFSMERGLRQGDPLAPFLFLIMTEGLHLLINEALEKGLYKGVNGPDNVINLLKVLKCFQAVSGLKLNLKKSKIYGIGVEIVEVQGWVNMLGCGFGELPFIYLGLPVGTALKRSSLWLPVIEKMKRKLSLWKAKMISFGGRRTLIKLVLGSVSLYYFLLLRAPVSVLKTLEGIRNNFFWGGGDGSSIGEKPKRVCHWVKWEKVVTSFERGGLSIGNLNDLNLCLLGKWWWRFMVERGSLWVRVIKSIYVREGGLSRDVVVGGMGRNSVWVKIIKVGEELEKKGIAFRNSFRRIVGNGVGTSFWEDVWIEEGRLREKYNRLYRLEVNKNVTVAGSGVFEGDMWSWKWRWRRNPRGRELGELERLWKLIQGGKPIKGGRGPGIMES